MAKTTRPTPAKAAPCPMCGERIADAEVLLFRCPGCGREGYDACCMPAGNNTLCLDCETAE